MAEFLNIKDLPVKDAFEDGDNVLILSNGKLYRCPEGGGGGGASEVVEANIGATYVYPNDSEPYWEFVSPFASISDDIIDNLYTKVNSGIGFALKLNVIDVDTEEVVTTYTIANGTCSVLTPEFVEEELGVEGKGIVIQGIDAVLINEQYIEAEAGVILLLPESVLGGIH